MGGREEDVAPRRPAGFGPWFGLSLSRLRLRLRLCWPGPWRRRRRGGLGGGSGSDGVIQVAPVDCPGGRRGAGKCGRGFGHRVRQPVLMVRGLIVLNRLPGSVAGQRAVGNCGRETRPRHSKQPAAKSSGTSGRNADKRTQCGRTCVPRAIRVAKRRDLTVWPGDQIYSAQASRARIPPSAQLTCSDRSPFRNLVSSCPRS